MKHLAFRTTPVWVACHCLLACGGDELLPHEGRWQLVEGVEGAATCMAVGYDATLTISKTHATVEERFNDDRCVVQTIDAPYRSHAIDGEVTFYLDDRQASQIRCAPDPCEAIVSNGEMELSVGRCPDSPPARYGLLPGQIHFRYARDQLIVRFPYWEQELRFARAD